MEPNKNAVKSPVDIRIESGKVFFAEDTVVRIGKDEINFLKEQMAQNNLKSLRLCMHRDVEDDVHEMFIIHSKENYVRPHKHPGKEISYHIIEGIADMVVFDEQGEVVDVIPLGVYGTDRKFYFRLNKVAYYAPYVRSEYLLFHETIKGPFQPSDTVYALWAVDGSDSDEVVSYRQELESRIDQFRKLENK